MGNVREKLMMIQAQLKASKGQYNSFGGYHYRNCEDILEALKPLLLEQKCVITLSDDIVQIGDRFYVKASACLADTEDDGGTVINTAYAREEATKKGMDGSQITGSSSSYARKYALNGLFCIDDTKDSDTTNSGDSASSKDNRKQESKTPPAKNTGDRITSEELANLQDVLAKSGKDIVLICKAYRVSALAELTKTQYENCLEKFAHKGVTR